MTIKLSDYINDENRKLTPEQIRRFLIDYGFDDVEEKFDEKLENSNMYEIMQERDQYKEERDTLIDDLAWYKAKVSRLEQTKENTFKGASNKIKRLEHKNKDLSIQFNEYIDETYGYLKLLTEISQYIGNKPASSTSEYFRAKLDDLGIKEDE